MPDSPDRRFGAPHAGQHATFEIECSAQIREILVPTCVEVAALPAANFGLIRFLLRHCLY